MTRVARSQTTPQFSRSRFTAFLSVFLLTLTLAAHAKADGSPTGFLPRAIRAQLAIPPQVVPPSLAPGQDPVGQHPTQPDHRDDARVVDQDPTASMRSTSIRVLNLLDYLKSHVTHETIDQLAQEHNGYNRRDDFGGWIVADSSKGCLDTRASVLVRSEDSATPITYKDTRNCLVVKGLWHDPYAGQDYKLAKAVQIDHVVPLKHVYMTGGDSWPASKRCYYANFLHNDFHLLAVSGHENMSKGDKSPDQYLPPNEAFQCDYVSSWMKVKAIWGLVATDAEIATIERVIQDHHCADGKLNIGEDFVAAEQEAMSSSIPTRCQDFGENGAPNLDSPPTADPAASSLPALH